MSDKVKFKPVFLDEEITKTSRIYNPISYFKSESITNKILRALQKYSTEILILIFVTIFNLVIYLIFNTVVNLVLGLIIMLSGIYFISKVYDYE